MDIIAWAARTSRTRRGNCLVGCLIALAVGVILLIVAGVVIALNWRGWASVGMDKMVDAMLADLPIDEAEKEETRAVVSDFLARFESGDVSMQQFGAAMKAIGESPLMPAGVVLGVGGAYFEKSGLTGPERDDGHVQLGRLAHGVANRTIGSDELVSVLRPLHAAIGDTQAWQFNLNGRTIRLKSPDITTDEQLREFIESARSAADAHGLPASSGAFDLSGELDKAIRRATEGLPPDGEPGTGDPDTGAQDGLAPPP